MLAGGRHRRSVSGAEEARLGLASVVCGVEKEAHMMRYRLVGFTLLVVVVLWTSLGWAEQPRYGGTLRIAWPGDPAFFNANQGPAQGAPAAWLVHNMYNSLLTLTPPPELKIVPDLAKSWEVLDEGQTYLFHLEQGVQFHDGTAFNAQAAKWNIDRILDPEVHSWVQPFYTAIDRVEAVDTSTLRVHMKEPFGSFDRALAGYFQ